MRAPGLASRRRRAARTALYGALAAVGVGFWLLSAVVERLVALREQWGEVDWTDRPEVALLRDYTRVPTTAGNEILGAEFLAERLAAEGVEATIERLGDGRANLWALIEGDRPEVLVLHHHLDVFAADDAEEWLHPPFAAEVEGPWLYGRGVFDMKSYAVAQLAAFLDLARSGRRPARGLMLLATSGEESGSRLGTRWFLRQHPELVSRMWAVLTEGGAVEALNPDDIKYFGIEASQLRLIRTTACSASRERLEALHEDLAAWPASELPPAVTPELERFFADYAPTRSRRLTRLHLEAPRDLTINRRGLDRLPRFARDLTSSARGLAPIVERPGGGYSTTINLLLVPGADPAASVDLLLPEWARHGITWTIGPPEGADHGSPPDHEAFRAAAEALRKAYPDTSVGSYFLPYNLTDARFFRAAGVPAYGFSPFLFFTTDTSRADRINERIPLPGFVSGVEIYVDAVRRMLLPIGRADPD
jgi:acetylornithine deacetylase/succinyl-diaminopimelate desuccinylase-like protein